MTDKPKLRTECPICAKPSDEAAKPFCSKRCADIDLGRWLKGSYAIPGQDGEATIQRMTAIPTQKSPFATKIRD